jgi:hypothetical protein
MMTIFQRKRKKNKNEVLLSEFVASVGFVYIEEEKFKRS